MSAPALPVRELPRPQVADTPSPQLSAPMAPVSPAPTPVSVSAPRAFTERAPQVPLRPAPAPVLRAPEPQAVTPKAQTPDVAQVEERGVGGGSHQPFRDELKKLPFLQETTQGMQTAESSNAFPSANTGRPLRNPPPASAPKNDLSTSRPITPSRPMPLAHLKSQQKSDKGPSTQNLSSLKELINAAFVSGPVERSGGVPAPQSQPELRTEIREQEKMIPKAVVVPTPPVLTPPSLLGDMPSPQSLKEVPEDILRNILAP